MQQITSNPGLPGVVESASHQKRSQSWVGMESLAFGGATLGVEFYDGAGITRHGKHLQKTMENHHAINGKVNYFYGHVQ